MVTKNWTREEMDLLDRLDFRPEFIEAARGNLFLLGLKQRDKFVFKVEGKEVSISLPHFDGPNLEGWTSHVYIPVKFVPVLHQIPTALATIGQDNPISQHTILKQSIQDMEEIPRSFLQGFVKSFDTHPVIQFAELLAEIISECLDVPFKPYRGHDHVARSQMYSDIHMIDGQFYVEMERLKLEAALEVFARAFDKVREIEAQQRGIRNRTDENVPALLQAFRETERPTDFKFWHDLFHGNRKNGEYAFRPNQLLEDHKLYKDALDPETFDC